MGDLIKLYDRENNIQDISDKSLFRIKEKICNKYNININKIDIIEILYDKVEYVIEVIYHINNISNKKYYIDWLYYDEFDIIERKEKILKIKKCITI